jgi:hypothetical protein
MPFLYVVNTCWELIMPRRPTITLIANLVSISWLLITPTILFAQIVIVAEEPPPGSLRPGETVYVTDGRCPNGKIDQIVEGYKSKRLLDGHAGVIPRQRRCVPRPH